MRNVLHNKPTKPQEEETTTETSDSGTSPGAGTPKPPRPAGDE